jgi:hypothetical protein
MGIVSGIGKVFTQYVPKAVKYSVRAAKVSPYIIFDNAGEKAVKIASKVTKGADETWTQAIWKAIKKGGKAAESRAAAAKRAAHGNMLKQGLLNIKSIPSVIKKSTVSAFQNSTRTGLGKVFDGTKGFFKGIGKKLPLIGNLLLVGFEIPNIVKATKEKGIGQGVIETGKTGVRLTVATLGAAIGGAAIPVVGGLVGFIAGEWLASKVIGKTYSEKKAESEEETQKLAELQQSQSTQTQAQQTVTNNSNISMQGGMTYPQQNGVTNPFSSFNLNSYDPYANDIMAQGINFNTLA